MSARLESEMKKDNESTEEGKQISYPAFTRTVSNSSFRNSTLFDVRNLNDVHSSPYINLPFPL